MKKITMLVMLLAFLSAGMVTHAQTVTKKERQENRKDGKPDMRYKNNKAPEQKAQPNQDVRMKKDGTPDMRYKNNKAQETRPAMPPQTDNRRTEPARPQPQPRAVPNTRVQPSPDYRNSRNNAPAAATPAPVNRTNNSADRAVGTDNKGRTIYEGPRGGRYYINGNGNKTYVKKDQ